MSLYCGQCGKEITRVKIEDDGIGLTGAYGTETVHTDKIIVTRCCGVTDIFKDKARSIPAVFNAIGKSERGELP